MKCFILFVALLFTGCASTTVVFPDGKTLTCPGESNVEHKMADGATYKYDGRKSSIIRDAVEYMILKPPSIEVGN